jgi:GNAT superfamily N-acetyltransferase
MKRNEHWKDLKDDFSVRPPTMDDVESAVDLFNQCSMDMIGVRDFTAHEVSLDWQSPGFNLAEDARAVFNLDGELVGLTQVWMDSHLPVHPFVMGRVRPDHENRGLGTQMFEWAVDRSKDAIARVPENARVAINAYAIASHKPSKKLLEDNGMNIFRHSWQMVIDLEDEIPEPEWPEGLVLRPYDHEIHGEEVYRADYESFRDHFGFVEEPFEEGYPRWLHSMIQDEHYDPTLWYLAFDGDQIAGGSISRPVSWEDPDAGWVRSLFVRRPWRRKGIALALLHHTFHEFRKRGKIRVGLGVDAGNLTGATGLYKKAGMQIKRQYDRFELELRPGIELSNNGNNS